MDDAWDIERDMAATPAEFARALRLAFPAAVLTCRGRWRIDTEMAGLEIATIELPPRVIALLRLPRLQVCMRFTHGTASARATLLAHLDRAMQRGGG